MTPLLINLAWFCAGVLVGAVLLVLLSLCAISGRHADAEERAGIARRS